MIRQALFHVQRYKISVLNEGPLWLSNPNPVLWGFNDEADYQLSKKVQCYEQEYKC